VRRIVSGVRVSASFQIVPYLVGRLGSEVPVNVSFQSFALRMSTPSCFCRPICHLLCQKHHFSVLPFLSCFSEIPQRCHCVFYGHRFLGMTTESHVKMDSNTDHLQNVRHQRSFIFYTIWFNITFVQCNCPCAFVDKFVSTHFMCIVLP